MITVLLSVFCLIAGYLLGSIMSAVKIARSKSTDIHACGSGNAGSTNVLRTFGWKWGLICLASDSAKGAASVGVGYAAAAIAPALFSNYVMPENLSGILGCIGLLGAILGHLLPVFYEFRGGKCVAVALGGLLVLSPVQLLIAVGCAVILIAIIASVAAIAHNKNKDNTTSSNLTKISTQSDSTSDKYSTTEKKTTESTTESTTEKTTKQTTASLWIINTSSSGGGEAEGDGKYENGKKVAVYTYDELNQLVWYADTRTGRYIRIVYDNYGNIQKRESYSLGTNWAPVKLLETRTYSYDDTNWKDKLTEFDGDSITYDKNGNPLTYRDDMTFEWENGRILKNINTSDKAVQMSYDSNGMRTQKSVDGVKTNYYYDSNKNLIALVKGNDTLLFYYDSDGSATSFSYNGTMYFYVKNLQGDVIRIIDLAGTEVASYVYDAWGNIKDTKGEPTIREINPIRYRGYVYDTETGLYYLQSRYYDPLTGRFVNADRVFDANASVTTYNQYAYCDNCPVIYLDSEGRGLFTSLVIGLVVGALVSGIIEAAKGGDVEDIITSAVAGGVSGLISVIPVFRNPYINSAIME